MARYWIFQNGKVEGPYGIEQLIRIRGFSRQSQVCVEGESGAPQMWITPAEIPELSHIFKAIDERSAEPAPAPRPVAPRKPSPAPRVYTPAVVVRPESGMSATQKGWIVLAVLLMGALAGGGYYHVHRQQGLRERQMVRSLVENLRLPGSSPYSTVLQMINEKGVRPTWEFEQKQEGLYQVTVSWEDGKPVTTRVHSFEVNAPAQSVRALNSAAAKLLSDSTDSPKPISPKENAKKESPKKKSAGKIEDALDQHLGALREGRFEDLWGQFSRRKKSEMARGGISRDGYMRLQALTRKVEGSTGFTQLKSHKESETEMLVLLKQSQEGRPEVFIKQLWVLEEGDWKLDDEQKKSAGVPEPAVPSIPTPHPAAATLPGMTN